ncbi:hypothetical protein [Pseudoalteromonas rubra]|uniref:hypothetical protein n=1 Tax=Pseudoalteromonas rubra TaxID=43658 RepID=UPI001107BF05|nr:hypothetical protein [Pseudoalteromonas rubra]
MRNHLVILSIFIFSLYAPLSKCAPNDLIGIWIINHNSEHVDYSFIEYQANGDKCEIEFSLVNSLDVTLYWNKWRLENGVIHSSIYNTTSFIEYGFEIGDKINTLNKNELFVDMVIPEGDYETEYHYKKHGAKSGQICDTVRKFFKNKSNEPTK